jgi:hypothetical protein
LEVFRDDTERSVKKLLSDPLRENSSLNSDGNSSDGKRQTDLTFLEAECQNLW